MTSLARRISESRHFHNIVLGVIVLTAVTVGLETYPALVERQAGLFTTLDWVVQTFFVLDKDTLIRSKLAAGREQDLADVAELNQADEDSSR